ncbi:MAG: protein-glutamine glutaminase family protein [Oligoflexales bacterium]
MMISGRLARMLLGILLVSCKSTSHSSAPKAFVTQEAAEKAFEIIKTTTAYIPFDNAKDGCFARAYFMSMELAIEQIPSSSQYVATMQGNDLQFENNKWQWHVAPALIIVPNPSEGVRKPEYKYREFTKETLNQISEEITIVDPSMAKEPISIREWVSLMLPKGTKTYALITPGNYYSSKPPPLLSDRPDVIRSFEELGNFKLSHIGRACGVLNKFLGTDRIRKARLSRRTGELITRLEYMGKLERDISKIDLSCPFIGW